MIQNEEDIFDAEISRRLNDPMWEARMARGVVRGESRRRGVYLGVAAAALFSFTASFLFLRVQKVGETTLQTSAQTEAREQKQMQAIDVDAFPYEEEGDVAVILDQDLYGE